MYEVVAKITNKNRIIGYELLDKQTGRVIRIKRENMTSFNGVVENCIVTSNGLLTSKVISMSKLKTIQFKNNNRDEKDSVFKVNNSEAILGTASKGNQYKWKKGNIWLKSRHSGV